MSERLNDPDPGRPKAVTNTEEQEVAVNHSTADHGYDEPANTAAKANITNANSSEPTSDEVGKERKPESKGSHPKRKNTDPTGE